MTDTTRSPLAEADPHSLDELIDTRIADIINQDPEKLSDAQLRIAVEYYRATRARFAREAAEGKTGRQIAQGAKRPAATAREAIAQASKSATLEDLL